MSIKPSGLSGSLSCLSISWSMLQIQFHDNSRLATWNSEEPECASAAFGANEVQQIRPRHHFNAIWSGDIINGFKRTGNYLPSQALQRTIWDQELLRISQSHSVQRGYTPFKEDLDLIFWLIEERDISILPINDDPDDWSNAMIRYNLLPNDTMIASTCRKHEIFKIATFDSDFLRVDWLSVINQSKWQPTGQGPASGMSTASIFSMAAGDVHRAARSIFVLLAVPDQFRLLAFIPMQS